MLTGSDFVKTIEGKRGSERAELVYKALAAGNVPLSMVRASWPPITIKREINNVEHSLTVFVTPRPLEVGTDDDPYSAPLPEDYAQKAADLFGAIIPSRLIIDDIWRAAGIRLPIDPPPGFKIPGDDMRDTLVFKAHSDIIKKGIGNKRSVIMMGGKKVVTIGPNLDGTKLAIYSTPFSGTGALRPAPAKDGRMLYQPYPGPHSVEWDDYAQGVWLVARYAILDGKPVDLISLFANPKLYVLVSDYQGFEGSGPFVPRFPNKQSSASVMKPKIGGISKISYPPKAEPEPLPDIAASLSSTRAGTSGTLLVLGGGLLLAALMLKRPS
jgi:hypothetical protein